MDFELDSEHEMIRQTVRDFAEKEVRPVAAHVDKTGEFPKATVAKMAGLGFLGVAIPTEYEGAGLDALALAIGIEEMARVCGSHALIMAAHNSLCTGTIWLAGTEAQKRKYIPDLASGRKIGTGMPCLVATCSLLFVTNSMPEKVALRLLLVEDHGHRDQTHEQRNDNPSGDSEFLVHAPTLSTNGRIACCLQFRSSLG